MCPPCADDDGRRTQAGDATDQWRDQWYADISQGSVATHLRCNGEKAHNIKHKNVVV